MRLVKNARTLTFLYFSPKIRGGTMKKAPGVILLLFVLIFTPHAKGTRKYSEESGS